MKIFRDKKRILIFLLIAVLILLYLFKKELHQHLKYNEVAISNEAENNGIDSNIQASDIWENISYRGNKIVTDNPWNMTVGEFEMEDEGMCIFLTPNTSMQIENRENQYDIIELMYQIHPAVKEVSDGAEILIWFLDDTEKVLFEEKVSVKPDDDWKQLKIDLEQHSEASKIEIFCNNGGNGNDNGDWVIVKFADENTHTPNMLDLEGYVKSATYFAAEWPTNFWNSEMDNLDSDMMQIKEDGFNSIIIVIPWREFQPEINPIQYNENAFAALDQVMKAADKVGLDVYTRIGYTWDYYHDADEYILDRFFGLLYDKKVIDAWYAYVSKMYDTLSKYDNFSDGFLTWEDFWFNLMICDDFEESRRLVAAHDIGYGDWVEQHYGLQEYNDQYGTQYDSYDSIAIPQRDEPAMYAMYEYYDEFLLGLLCESQKKFSNLSMEVRLDHDLTYNKNGEFEPYKHIDTFSCGESSFTATMYGIPMGFENVGERVSYSEGMEKTQYILSQLQQQNENKAIYVEQFLFADNTPEYAHNAQIRNDEIDDYLENVSDILLKYTSGYGIWTYRNYRANIIYNAQFALNDDGWECEGDVQFKIYEESRVCELDGGSSISQEVAPTRISSSDDHRVFICVKDVIQPGDLKITVGDAMKTVNVEEEGIIEFDVPQNSLSNLKIESLGCNILVDDIKLYAHVQEGFLYDEDGNELSCIESIRMLNKQLEKR